MPGPATPESPTPPPTTPAGPEELHQLEDLLSNKQ